jgi:hypothetical protein
MNIMQNAGTFQHHIQCNCGCIILVSLIFIKFPPPQSAGFAGVIEWTRGSLVGPVGVIRLQRSDPAERSSHLSRPEWPTHLLHVPQDPTETLPLQLQLPPTNPSPPIPTCPPPPPSAPPLYSPIRPISAPPPRT